VKFEINKTFAPRTWKSYDKNTQIAVCLRTYGCLKRIGVYTLFELLTKTRTELEDASVYIDVIAECARKEGYTDWADNILRDDIQHPFSSGRMVHTDHIRRKP